MVEIEERGLKAASIVAKKAIRREIVRLHPSRLVTNVARKDTSAETVHRWPTEAVGRALSAERRVI